MGAVKPDGMNRDNTGIWDTKRDSAGCSVMKCETLGWFTRNPEKRDWRALRAGSAGSFATLRKMLGVCVATNREPMTFPAWEGEALP